MAVRDFIQSSSSAKTLDACKDIQPVRSLKHLSCLRFRHTLTDIWRVNNCVIIIIIIIIIIPQPCFLLSSDIEYDGILPYSALFH